MSDKKRVAIIGAHGIGDAILSLQCAHYVKQQGNYCDSFVAVRDEVFTPLKHVFPNIIQLPEILGENNNFIKDENLIKTFQEKWGHYDEIYYVIPDLLFNNIYAFDWQKYKVHPRTIMQTRLLTHLWRPTKQVYVGLTTSTPTNVYKDVRGILLELSKQLPNHTIYFPNIKSWAGSLLSFGDLSNLPSNVYIDDSNNFIHALENLVKSEYGIFCDNGPSHIAYHLGIPRLLIDHRYTDLRWECRWREDTGERFPSDENSSLIAQIAKLNIEFPQTNLIDKRYFSLGINDKEFWKQSLFLKTE